MSELRSTQPDRVPSYPSYTLSLSSKLQQEVNSLDPETLAALTDAVDQINKGGSTAPGGKLDQQTLDALNALLGKKPC